MKNKIAKLIFIIMIISGWAVGFLINEIIHYNVNQKDFNDYKVSELKKGNAYTGDVNMVLDIIASSEDEKSSYYLIVISKGDYEGYCILETSHMQSEIENLCQQSWDYMTGESDNAGTPVHIRADLCEAEDDVIKWAEEWFENDGNADAVSELCQYKLVQRENSLTKSVILLAIFVAVFAGSVIFYIIWRKKSIY